jgi:hypothetical protein
MGTSCSNQDIIDENNINIERIETLEDDIDKLKTEKEELNSQIQELKTIKKASEEEKQFYLQFITKLTEPMSETYLTEIAQEQWKYSILVDEVSIPQDGIIETSENSFKLIVSEAQAPYIALPTEIHNKGKISGDLFSTHIKFLNVKPTNTSGSEEDKISSTTYTFSNLNNEIVINLEISKELQKRLGLNTNIITVKKVDPTTLEDSQATDAATEEESNDNEEK